MSSRKWAGFFLDAVPNRMYGVDYWQYFKESGHLFFSSRQRFQVFFKRQEKSCVKSTSIRSSSRFDSYASMPTSKSGRTRSRLIKTLWKLRSRKSAVRSWSNSSEMQKLPKLSDYRFARIRDMRCSSLNWDRRCISVVALWRKLSTKGCVRDTGTGSCAILWCESPLIESTPVTIPRR